MSNQILQFKKKKKLYFTLKLQFLLKENENELETERTRSILQIIQCNIGLEFNVKSGKKGFRCALETSSWKRSDMGVPFRVHRVSGMRPVNSMTRSNAPRHC